MADAYAYNRPEHRLHVKADPQEIDIPKHTLRDMFAGLAMQGFIANGIKEEVGFERYLAITAYGVADAMLKEREHEPTYSSKTP